MYYSYFDCITSVVLCYIYCAVCTSILKIPLENYGCVIKKFDDYVLS